MFRSGNPALNPAAFAGSRTYGLQQTMTVQGTVNKCFILFGLLMLSASWMWSRISNPEAAAGAMPLVWGAMIVGLILALVTVFNIQWAKFTAPAYALCEGVALGGISALFEGMYKGIVFQAVALTFGTLFVMLGVYKSGLVKVTNKFIMGVTTATMAVALFYLVSFILGFFGVHIAYFHSSGPFSIGLSLFICGLAALNLILDFHVIEQGEAQGAGKVMEWYGAFALMVTLIWLYIEILRLLAKMNNRR